MFDYTANQPLLFPHIYMMNRFVSCKNLVIMEEAQFTKFGHQSRVELLDHHGNEVLLKVPLKDRSFKRLDEVRLHQPERLPKKFMATTKSLYGKLPYYRLMADRLFYAVTRASLEDSLCEFNRCLFEWLCDEIWGSELPFTIYRSKEIVPDRAENPSEWVAQLGAAINCKSYLGGRVAQDAYLKQEHFDKRGMVFVAQNFKMTPYTRWGNQKQESATVSVVDPLFIGGPDLVRELICRSPV